MPRDNEAIIELLHQAQAADRELLKQLVDAGAGGQTLSMVIERLRLSDEAVNYIGEEGRIQNEPPRPMGGAIGAVSSLGLSNT